MYKKIKHRKIQLYRKNLSLENKKLNIVLDLDNTIICTIILDSINYFQIKLTEILKN
jgi:predicted secreted acid phosphatase